MKNKSRKILMIVSIIIFILGILCCFKTNSFMDKNESIISFFSIFGLVAFLWSIYIIVLLSKKIKTGDAKWKNFSIVCVLSIFVILISLLIFPVFSTISNEVYIKNKYDYYIKYQDSMNTYNIYKLNHDVKVYIEEQVQCIKDPCPTLKTNHKVKFSETNMKIVHDFIKSFFEDHKDNSIQIFSKNLSNEQDNILKSIIYNDENLLNNMYDLKTQQYTIVTDSKYQTLLNDGGSNYNIYYELDLNSNIIKKYEDHYIGFKGYEYQKKLVYEKLINNDISIEMNELLFDLFLKEDINDTNNYSPYTIKSNHKEKDIYNEKSINSLQTLLNKIDNISNE